MSGIISGSVVPSVKENVINWNYDDDEKHRVENHLESLGIKFISNSESTIILDPNMEFDQIDPLLQKKLSWTMAGKQTTYECKFRPIKLE